MMKTMTFEHGQLLGAAMAVLALYEAMSRATQSKGKSEVADALCEAMNKQAVEMIRLADNVIQIRNDWSDPIQLAGLIVFLIGNYRSTALDA